MEIQGKRVEVCSSSELKGKVEGQYSVKNLFDGKKETAWVEGVEGAPAGQWVSVEFKNEVFLTGIEFFPGYQKSKASFDNNSLPDFYELQIGDVRYSNSFFDEDAELSFFKNKSNFPHFYLPIDSKAKTLKIFWGNGVYNRKFKDMAVSEINLLLEDSPVKNYLKKIESGKYKIPDTILRGLKFPEIFFNVGNNFSFLDSLNKSSGVKELNEMAMVSLISGYIQKASVTGLEFKNYSETGIVDLVSMILDSKKSLVVSYLPGKIRLSKKLNRISGTQELEKDIGCDVWITHIVSLDNLELISINLDVAPYSFH